jgi:hypothetical protein
MQTRIRERPAPALAGGLAVIGGVAVWQLGLEFERIWLRSYEGPLLGETLPGPVDAQSATREQTQGTRETRSRGERRRWVAEHHPRSLPRPRNGASPSSS